MTDLTPEKREELRTLLDNATPRPWAAATPGNTTETRAQWITSALLAPDAPAAGGLWVAWVPDDHTFGIRIAATTGDGPHAEPDADLIAEAANTLPALLDAADDRDRLAAAVERVRALHERDGEGFCVVCDYMTPHPCPTLRALDDTEDPAT